MRNLWQRRYLRMLRSRICMSMPAFYCEALCAEEYFLFSILSIAFVSSISPGALGIYEFFGLWVLKQFGKPKEQALAFLLASHGAMFAVLALCILIVAVQETWALKAQKTG